MGNTIGLAKIYSDILNEVWSASAKTAVLETSDYVRQGANANEIVIPNMRMDGLGNYSRTTGFVGGDASLIWKTVSFDYDRGRMFTVDSMDDQESQNIAFARLANEFMRSKVIPELDAYRFAKLAQAGVTPGSSPTINSGATAVAAIRDGVNSMDDKEVGEEERYLFVTPVVKAYLDDMDTYKSKQVLARFADVITVPQARFYSAITLYDGSTAGQTAGGYIKRQASADPVVAAGADIRFMIVHKPDIICYTKHTVSKIITPEQNQDADAWKYGYRSYGLTTVLPNKDKTVTDLDTYPLATNAVYWA